MFNFRHLTIFGCGLIGGSIALALRRAGYDGRMTACGGKRGPQLARERGLVDEVEESFERGEVCPADVIYLAAPIGGIIDFLRQHGRQIRPGALVTDAGSTKVEICRVARAALPPEANFVGGHPMAGSEHTGIEYARADLFDRAVYAIMAEPGTDPTRAEQIIKLAEAIGARPLLTEPEPHDHAVALISHLPQLVASALAGLLGGEGQRNSSDTELAQRLAASGWRDMTRLAGSSWNVWRDICLTNQSHIAASLSELIDQLQALREAFERRDFNAVRDLFETANRLQAEHRAIHYRSFEKL